MTEMHQPRKSETGEPTNNGGEFGSARRGESGKNLTDFDCDTDMRSWTPVDIDSRLATLYGQRYVHESRLSSHNKHLENTVGRALRPQSGYRATATREEIAEAISTSRDRVEAGTATYVDRGIIRDADEANTELAAIDRLDYKIDILDTEFEMRGGWTRAFLVNNTNGHVHSSMRCSTCTPTTQYHWVTEYSDTSEDEVVEAAGERACTVCYPSAPVNTLNRPTTIFSPEEKDAQQRRIEREQAKVERDAKVIEKALTPDGSPFTIRFVGPHGHPNSETFKTEQSATQWLVSNMVTYRYNYTHMTETDELLAARQQIKDAIRAKHGMTEAELEETLEKKVKAKAKRDGYDG